MDATFPSTSFHPMFNIGSTALPWEPYTGGIASPNPNYPQDILIPGSDGDVEVKLSNDNQEKILTGSTPNGLPGIPVSSGGNYTDENGQQWVCDEVDFERGVHVQRVQKVMLDDTVHWYKSSESSTQYPYFIYQPLEKSCGGSMRGFADAFPVVGISNTNNSQGIGGRETDLYLRWSERFLEVEDVVAFFSASPCAVFYAMKEPIETPLSDEELASYAALKTYDGSTTISSSDDIDIYAKAVTSAEVKGDWANPTSELTKYWEAFAGFEDVENLPMPSSRETKLLRAILDPSYQLDFVETDESSRNEKYLWDLKNGTSKMLANIPKSDTEKFLHVLIGGDVEQYPTVDTELDFWMDICVELY